MSELRRAGEEALFWASIDDAVREIKTWSRMAALNAMLKVGSERQRVTDAADNDMGTLTIGAPHWDAQVTNEAALLEWVTRNRPSEIVQMVRPAYINALKAQAEANARDPEGPGPYPIDRDTGARIPGIEAARVPGTFTIRKTSEARQRATALLDEMLGRVVPQIEGGTDVR